MSMIVRGTNDSTGQREILGEFGPYIRHIGGGNDLCSICGQRQSDAFWSGERPILICFHCATVSLPKLIADAVAGHSISTNRLARARLLGIKAVDAIKSNFWYAYAMALEAGLHRNLNEDETHDDQDA